MTRDQFKARLRRRIQQAVHGALDGDPFGEDEDLDQAANDVCKATDCFWRDFTANVVADQSLYCAPLIYKMKGISLLDSTGNIYRPTRLNMAQMDRADCFWRNWPTATNPRYIITEGLTRYILAPTPSEGRAAGIIFRGFALTADNTTAQTFHLWPNGTDECPLPQYAQDAVLCRFAVLRLMQLMASNPEVAPLMSIYQQQYDGQIGTVEALAAKRYSESANGDWY